MKVHGLDTEEGLKEGVSGAVNGRRLGAFMFVCLMWPVMRWQDFVDFSGTTETELAANTISEVRNKSPPLTLSSTR